MGRLDSNLEHRQTQGPRKRKSKGRMRYLKKRREGGGNGNPSGESKTDEHGQLYGDYVPAYEKESGPGRRRWQGQGNFQQGQGGGRRPKQYLKVGMKGFLCTTNFKEWECVRDAYNILNEYSEENDGKTGEEKSQDGSTPEGGTPESQNMTTVSDPSSDGKEDCLKSTDGSTEAKEAPKPDEVQVKTIEIEITGGNSGSDPDACEEKDADNNSAAAEEKAPMNSNQSSDDQAKEGNKADDEDDIDAALNNELKELKDEKTAWKFQSVNTGLNNVIFIKTTIDNPTELVYKIFEDVSEKKQTKSRSLMRMLPIEFTCSIYNLDEVKGKIKEYIEKYLKTGYVSYKIEVNARYSSWFGKGDLIQTLAEMVFKANPLSFVDLNNPQYTILIDVLKTIACIGIVKDFTKYKRYNLFEVGYSGQNRGRNGKNFNRKGQEKEKNAEVDVGNSNSEVEVTKEVEEKKCREDGDADAVAKENQSDATKKEAPVETTKNANQEVAEKKEAATDAHKSEGNIQIEDDSHKKEQVNQES